MTDFENRDVLIDSEALPKKVSDHPDILGKLSIARFFERLASYLAANMLFYYFMEEKLSGDSMESAYKYYQLILLSFVLIQIPVGFAVDWLGKPEKALVWGGLAFSLGYFLLAFATSFTKIAGLGLVLIGSGLYSPSTFVVLGKHYRGRRRFLFNGYAYFFGSLQLGALVAGILLTYALSYLGWREGLMLSGIILLAGHLYLLFSSRGFLDVILTKHETAKTTTPKFLKVLIIGVLVLQGILIYYGNERLLSFLMNVNSQYNLSAFGQFSVSIVTALFLFIGAGVVSGKEKDVLKRVGLGSILSILILIGITALLTQYQPGAGAGMVIAGISIVGIGLIEFLIAPGVYSLILNCEESKVGTAGILNAIRFIPYSGLIWSFGFLQSKLVTGINEILITIGLTVIGIYLIKQKEKINSSPD